MKPRMGILLSALAALVTPVALTACGQETEVNPTDEASPDATLSDLAPAITAPGEILNATGPPSYEVAIATTAANRNNALARCAKQPEVVRTQCEQETNAVYADAEAKLQDLRGNQE